MLDPSVIQKAQRYCQDEGLTGWLLYDYRHSNPVFWQVVGESFMVTRPCFLFIPTGGEPRLLVHHVDAGKFRYLPWKARTFRNRQELLDGLRELVSGATVAMEYSPSAQLPRISHVDAGVVELLRGLGATVVSSADLLQYATQCWSPAQLASHQRAARALSQIVLEAFQFIGRELPRRPTEYAVAEFLRRRLHQEGLETADGPGVQVNQHSSDPHYEPSQSESAPIGPGDWVLIDLWAREPGPQGIYADITWVGYVGQEVPEGFRRVFEVVVGARDAALEYIHQAHQEGKTLQGWEVDQVARRYIQERGYGDYFTHRLGHSLGREVHGEAVNLDSWETHDTRRIIPGLGFTIEPGIYLPSFGVRSEIDVYMAQEGPVVTTEVQREVVRVLG